MIVEGPQDRAVMAGIGEMADTIPAELCPASRGSGGGSRRGAPPVVGPRLRMVSVGLRGVDDHCWFALAPGLPRPPTTMTKSGAAEALV
ncbi:hypothetical protein NL676_023345 [Syzygium grande]|nr:hypothetical protein NL676_023345 [Syzygium grande]